jgi:hypothetical protein
MAIVYSGGTYVSTTFAGTTKAAIITALQTQLTNAGWTVISGSGTTNLLMQTAQDPTTHNQGRVRFKDNSGTCVQVTIENVSGTATEPLSTTNGGNLIPGSSLTYRIIATKYQFFCFVAGSYAVARRFVCAGIIWIPSFLQGVITEDIYMLSDSQSDTDTTTTNAYFRNSLNGSINTAAQNSPNQASIVNGSLMENASNNNANWGLLHLIVPYNSDIQNNASGYRYHDLSVMISEPLLAHGTSSASDEALIRGQLYDCCVLSDTFTIDSTTSITDSGTAHTFWNLTAPANVGTTQNARGSLFVATS